MTDLSPQARALLNRGNPAYEPRPSDRPRIRAGVAAGVSAAASAAAAGTGLAVKASVFVASVVIGSLGVWAGTQAVRSPTPAAEVHVVRATVPAPAPAVEASAPVSEAAVPSAVPVESAPAARRVNTPAPAPARKPPSVPAPGAAPPIPDAPTKLRDDAPPSGCSTVDELAALEGAHRWLSSDAPREALRVLERLAERCPDGKLVEERLATRAIAHCKASELDDGRADYDALVARNPGSPALSRVRQACSIP